MSEQLQIGSLCSGTGALDRGLMSVIGGSVAWHCENDPHAAKVLAARYPGVPNYGDLTAVDWTSVEPVDWLTAGYPCPPFSQAGQRKGEADDRYIWPHIARAIAVLRPGHVLLENVAGHVSLGLDRVIAELAAMGYVGRYGVVRASDAGAPHERARVFVIASLAAGEQAGSGGFARPRPGLPTSDADRLGRERAGCARGRRGGSADLNEPLADSGQSGRRQDDSGLRERQPDIAGRAAADSARDGWDEGRAESARLVGRPDAAERRHTSTTDADDIEQPRQRLQHVGATPAGHCEATCAVGRGWRTADGRDYAPAIRRWHDLTRCVPAPTVADGRGGAHRLNARFEEWMMGLPAGWVTDILPRSPAMKCLGNGCVPAQVALAVQTLLGVEQVAA